MKFEEYIPLAARTISYLGSKSKDLAHMGLGIASEYAEIEQAFMQKLEVTTDGGVFEEFGDLCWYIAGAIKILNTKERENIDDHIKRWEKAAIQQYKRPALNSACSNVIDTIKKHFAYKIPILDYQVWWQNWWMNWRIARHYKVITSHDLVGNLYEIIMCIVCECAIHKIKFSDVLEYNINKLAKRYPEGYSDYHAAARLDKTATSNETKRN